MTKGTVRFLDTNVLLRYLLRDDEEKAKRALGLLSRMEQGRERVATSPMVIFEVVFTLQRRHQVPRQQIRDSLKDILSLRGLELPNKRLYERALDLYASHNLSFPDAFHAVYMGSRGGGRTSPSCSGRTRPPNTCCSCTKCFSGSGLRFSTRSARASLSVASLSARHGYRATSSRTAGATTWTPMASVGPCRG